LECKYQDEEGNEKNKMVPASLQVKKTGEGKLSSNSIVIETKGVTAIDSVIPVKTNTGNQANYLFNICPYCGKELKLPKTPNFCPYCREKLVS
jgi:rubrerythrin